MKKYCILIVIICWVKGAAVEFTVTTTNDSVDADISDGLCLDSIGECSLRATIMQSNILGTVDDDIEDRVFEIHAGELISFKGIFISQGDATNSLSNQGQGGGIYVSEQVPEFRITDSIIAFNQAMSGAGLYSHAAVTWIDKTDISYNLLKSPGFPLFSLWGAAIYHNGMQLTLNKSAIHHNLTENVGAFASAL